MTKRPNQEINLKEIFYRKNPNVQYTVKNGEVTIIRPQNHWIQRFFRKLHFKIPAEAQLTLDDFGSFVFLQIAENRSVYQIGEALAAHSEEASDLLYERLLVFLNHLDQTEQLISRVDKG